MRFSSINTKFALIAVLATVVSTLVGAEQLEPQYFLQHSNENEGGRKGSRYAIAELEELPHDSVRDYLDGFFTAARLRFLYGRRHNVINKFPYGAWQGLSYSECNTAPNALSWIKNGSAKKYCVQHEGTERCWFTFVPDSAKDTAKLPVVVDLHGMGGCATRPSMGWANLAEDNGFIVVWPQGLNKKLPQGPQMKPLANYKTCWNDGTNLTGCNKDRVDDVGFLEKVVQKVLSGNTNIDPNRVYFSGHSNGGVMAQRFVLETAEKNIVAGLVVIGANTYPRFKGWIGLSKEDEVKFNDAAYNPIPVFFVAGRYDGMSPYVYSDKRKALSGAEPALEGWAKVNKCKVNENGSADTVAGDGYNHHSIHRGCDNGAHVELLEVLEAGHHAITKGRGQFKLSPQNVIPSCPFRRAIFFYEPDCTLIDIDTTAKAWYFISKFERTNSSA